MAKQLSCGVEFMRGTLLVLNILFVIVGLALIGLGIYIKVDTNFTSILSEFSQAGNFKGQALGFLAFVMIGGGVFTVLIALFGCVGALWHNRCFLYMYAIILLILMILELAAVIMALVYKSKLRSVYDESLSQVLDKALRNNQDSVLSAFRDLENLLKCCGVKNISDYAKYPNVTKSDFCKEKPDASGCADTIIDFLNKNLPIIGGTLGGVILIELFGLIAAIALAIALKHAPSDNYSSNPGRGLSNLMPRRR